MKNPSESTGFSLIEILIAVAILGILASIAVPSYGRYVTESRRVDAHVALRSAAQSLERCKTENFSYTGCTVPNTSPDGNYTIAVTIPAAGTTYSVTASADSGGQQANDSDCASLSINHAGVTTAANDSGNTSTNCW